MRLACNSGVHMQPVAGDWAAHCVMLARMLRAAPPPCDAYVVVTQAAELARMTPAQRLAVEELHVVGAPALRRADLTGFVRLKRVAFDLCADLAEVDVGRAECLSLADCPALARVSGSAALRVSVERCGALIPRAFEA